MVDILKIIQDTPIPSILVIGGIVFLLLAFVRKAGTAIETDPSQKGWMIFIGLVLLGAGIGLYLIPTTQVLPAATQVAQSGVATNTPASQSAAVPTAIAYDGWVICWHGRDGYEYLIGYPEDQARQGINLVFNLTNAQGEQSEVANDSLKMCYANGEWYGRPDPNNWFPTVSYLKLLDGEIQVCSDTLCQENQWALLPQDYVAWNAPQLQAPTQTGIHIISFKSTR